MAEVRFIPGPAQHHLLLHHTLLVTNCSRLSTLPFPKPAEKLTRRDKKPVQETQVGARVRDYLIQGEVQDQSKEPGEGTGGRTLVLLMQPEAGLRKVSGHLVKNAGFDSGDL